MHYLVLYDLGNSIFYDFTFVMFVSLIIHTPLRMRIVFLNFIL